MARPIPKTRNAPISSLRSFCWTMAAFAVPFGVIWWRLGLGFRVQEFGVIGLGRLQGLGFSGLGKFRGLWVEGLRLLIFS